MAIKLLLEEVSQNAEWLARFDRESRVLASLNHHNIASLHAFEREDDTNFLVMELVEGETMADRIASGPIPVEEVIPLFIQIAEGLEAAHENAVLELRRVKHARGWSLVTAASVARFSTLNHSWTMQHARDGVLCPPSPLYQRDTIGGAEGKRYPLFHFSTRLSQVFSHRVGGLLWTAVLGCANDRQPRPLWWLD